MMHRRLLLAIALLATASVAPATDDYADARRALATALQAGDDERALTHARAALRLRPGYPPLLGAMAGIHARLSHPDAALAALVKLAEAGVVADVSAHADFEAVRGLDRYERLRARQTALRKPVGHYRIVARLDQPTFVPEGIAVDANGRFYLGSIRHARIVRIDDGATETLVADKGHGLASVFGLRLDEQAGVLWACTAVVPQATKRPRSTAMFRPPVGQCGKARGVPCSQAQRSRAVIHGNSSELVSKLPAGKRLGRSGIFRFRTQTGEKVDAHWLPDDGERHVLGDLIVLDRHTAITTDSVGGGVYELDARSGVFSAMIPPGRLASPQGIAFDSSRGTFFVADWSGGLFRFHRPSGALERLDGPAGTMLYGIDGLYLHEGDLIAVQNLAVPHRVTRIDLNREGTAVTAQRTLARALPEFDEPTLGAVRDDVLYLNANSHWNRFDAEHALPSADSLTGPIVLAIPLSD